MWKPIWGFFLSTAFAIALTITPLPERWRVPTVIAAWSLCAIAAVGWGFSHLLDKRAPGYKQALLTKIRDLVLSTKTKPLAERIDVIGALIKFSHEFKNEKQVEWTLVELEQRQFQNPFKVLESAAPSTFKKRKLEFLRDARTATIEIRSITSAISFAVKYWRHSEDYKKAHRAVMGWDELEREETAAAEEPQEAKPTTPVNEPATPRPELVLWKEGVSINIENEVCFFFEMKNTGPVLVKSVDFTFVIQTAKMETPPVVWSERTSQAIAEGTSRRFTYSFPKVPSDQAYIAFYISYIGDSQEKAWDNDPMFFRWDGIKGNIIHLELKYLRDEEIISFTEYLRKHEVPKPLLQALNTATFRPSPTS